MKKLTAALLALVMALTLCTAAWADTPTVKPSYDWFDDKTGPYTISNDADLLGFANIVNGTRSTGDTPYSFAGATVKLANDIDLGGQTWTPIGGYDTVHTAWDEVCWMNHTPNRFKGTFDGDGHTISNFKLNATDHASGFFTFIEGTIRNVTFSNVTATINATSKNVWFGTVASVIGGTAENVTVQNVKVNVTGSYSVSVGGMFGYYGWTTATNCRVIGLDVTSTGGCRFVGGFTARATVGGTGNDCDCKNYINCDVQGMKANVTDNESSYGTFVGGFIGYCNKRWNHPGYDGCDVTGIDFTVAGNVNAGGFIACPKAAGTAVNCTTQGKINATGVTSTNNCVGGFYANGSPEWQENNVIWHRMTNCVADVDIVSGGAPAGGFFGTVGGVLSHAVELTNCEAKGDVTNENGVAGGFAGVNRGSTTRASAGRAEMPASAGTYTGCVASGTVQGKVAGGFAGEVGIPADDGLDNDSKLVLKGCEVKGTVVGSDAAGGLVGQVTGTKNGANNLTINVDADTKVDSALVVGTKSNTKTSGSMNMQTPGDSNVTVAQGFKKATTVQGDGVTVSNGVVNAPNGATVTDQNDKSTKVPAGTQLDAATGNQLFTVTFVSDGVEKAKKNVASGAKVTAPTDLTKDGYHIAHWHRQGGTDTAFNFDNGITENITLVAHWEKNTYTVKFNTDGGSAVTDQTVAYGDKVTKPANPTKSGYTFTHWHVAGSADDAAFDFNTTITGDLTLTAHWTKNSSGRYHGPSTPTAPVESPKTFDAGIAVYGVMAVSSVLGMGYIGKKKF